MVDQQRYVLISPCRDEEQFLRQSLDSVIAQTVPPALWVVVDDGSTDRTPAILSEYASKHDFIRVVRRKTHTQRNVGPGVVEAFYAGLDSIDFHDFDYLCKLDLDVELPNRYFELLLNRMEANPRIGTCSGKSYCRHPSTGELVSEGIGDDVSVGMTKLYRAKCFEQIGGFVTEVMWDGIDCHRCRMRGWIACSWDDPELRFTHLRPMGSSHRGIMTGRWRHGFGQYFMGTGILYLLASATYRLRQRPFGLGAAAMVWGYLQSMLTRKPRYDDAEFRRFLRGYQWQTLLKGKSRAIQLLDDKQQNCWNVEDTERRLSFSDVNVRQDKGTSATTKPGSHVSH